MSKTEELSSVVANLLGERARSIVVDRDEVTVTVFADDYPSAALLLRDEPSLRFEQLIDLCGVDYSGYGGSVRHPKRFAAVSHLLSVSQNQRLRLCVYAEDDEAPVVASLTTIWPAAAWFEREAFDMFGLMFEGHPDLRRILTDYGFVGHPFRKDFPVSGHMEMTYDREQGRVVYQPVTIEPRENTPRIVREETYGGGRA